MKKIVITILFILSCFLTSCAPQEQTEETGGSKLSVQSEFPLQELLLEDEYDIVNFKDNKSIS